MATAPTGARNSSAIGMIIGATAKRSIIVANGPAESSRTLNPASRIAAEKPSEMRNLTPSPASDYIQATVGLGLEGSGHEGTCSMAAPAVRRIDHWTWVSTSARRRGGRRRNHHLQRDRSGAVHRTYDRGRVGADRELQDGETGRLERDSRALQPRLRLRCKPASRRG